MRQSAWFAWRFPPRLSRWRRVTLPEVASRGATPHSCAQAASLRTRWGLSPEGDRVEPAVGAAGSVTLRNGACLVPAPRPSRQAPQPTRYNNESDPTTETGEPNHHQTQAGGPHHRHPQSHWQLCAVERCLQVATVEADKDVNQPSVGQLKAPAHTRGASPGASVSAALSVCPGVEAEARVPAAWVRLVGPASQTVMTTFPGA
jgi:hypothetical protein